MVITLGSFLKPWVRSCYPGVLVSSAAIASCILTISIRHGQRLMNASPLSQSLSFESLLSPRSEIILLGDLVNLVPIPPAHHMTSLRQHQDST